MPELAYQHAFSIYALCAVVLCLNLLALWAYSGVVRGKTKTTPNNEDASTTAKGSKVVDQDPPEVARVLRVHRNAMYNVMPFLVLGLIYCLNGCGTRAALVVFGSFTVFRLAHTFAYLRGVQPWRSLFFTLGGLVTFALVVQVVRGAIAHLMM